jgi:FimV-like protein
VRQFNLVLAIVLSYASLVGYLVTPLSAEEIHTYGPIKAGDMLWTIAAKVSPPSMNRHQVILALQQANPQAFSVPCNINSLKVGETLRIPSLTEMQAFTPEKAIEELNRQDEEWRNRHNKNIVCPPTPPATEKISSPATEVKQTPVPQPAAATTTTASQPEAQPTTANVAVTTVQPEQVTPASDSSTPPPVNVAQAPTPEVSSLSPPTSVSPPPATTSPVATQDNQLALVPEAVETGDSEATEPPSLSPTIPLTREPSKAENPYILYNWNSAKLIAVFTIAAVMLMLLLMWLRRKSAKRNLAKPEKLGDYTFTEPITEMPLQFDRDDKSSS